MMNFKYYLTSIRGSSDFKEQVNAAIGEPSCSRDFSIKAERKGFVVTAEIMMTLIMIAVVVLLTLYAVNVYQTQRYFAQVAASTCTMASRYGGNDSAAYRVQVGEATGGTIESNAQKQLDYINDNGNMFSKDFHATIKVADHADDDGYVSVSLTYYLGDYGMDGENAQATVANAFGLLGYKYTQNFSVPSIMSNGKLTGMTIT